jgi:hypothetical protein
LISIILKLIVVRLRIKRRTLPIIPSLSTSRKLVSYIIMGPKSIQDIESSLLYNISSFNI